MKIECTHENERLSHNNQKIFHLIIIIFISFDEYNLMTN
jgi:hypothetical protein